MDTFATEKDRYKEVYLSTGDALLNFARKFVPEFYAEDIVHDVYLRFWDKQIYKLPNEELRSLLYTAVRNACIDHLRKLQTEQFTDFAAFQLRVQIGCCFRRFAFTVGAGDDQDMGFFFQLFWFVVIHGHQ